MGHRAANQPEPIDGISIVGLIDGKMTERPRPIPFWFTGENEDDHAVLIDHEWKLHTNARTGKRKNRRPAAPVLLYNLEADIAETRDLAAGEKERVDRMRTALTEWKASVRRSQAGRDYR